MQNNPYTLTHLWRPRRSSEALSSLPALAHEALIHLGVVREGALVAVRAVVLLKEALAGLGAPDTGGGPHAGVVREGALVPVWAVACVKEAHAGLGAVGIEGPAALLAAGPSVGTGPRC